MHTQKKHSVFKEYFIVYEFNIQIWSNLVDVCLVLYLSHPDSDEGG